MARVGQPLPQPAPHLHAHDVVIVLGAAVLRGGRASPALRRRVAHAAALYAAGAGERLLLAGGIVRYSPSEAELMADIAAAAGVPRTAIELEARSRTTWENAANCAALMRSRGWRSAVLVTDAWHMRRALLAFHAFGVDPEPSAAPHAAGAGPYVGARELAALALYGLRAARVRYARGGAGSGR